MAEVTYISPIRVDEHGSVHVTLEPAMLEMLGWTVDDDLEWDVVGNMAIVRKHKR